VNYWIGATTFPARTNFFQREKKKLRKCKRFYNKAKTILDLSNLFNKFINLNNTNK
jgi:hypothetical protein